MLTRENRKAHPAHTGLLIVLPFPDLWNTYGKELYLFEAHLRAAQFDRDTVEFTVYLSIYLCALATVFIEVMRN